MKCPRCGSENAEGRAVCWKCYAFLTGPSREALEKEAARPESAPPPRARERPARAGPSPLPRIVAAVVLLAIAGGGLWWYFLYLPNHPENVALGYVGAREEAAREGKVYPRAALPFLCKKDRAVLEIIIKKFGESGPAAAGAAVKELAAAGKVTIKHKVESVSREGGRAVVKVRTSSGKKGETLRTWTDPYVLVKEDGKWKIDQDATWGEAAREHEMPAGEGTPSPPGP